MWLDLRHQHIAEVSRYGVGHGGGAWGGVCSRDRLSFRGRSVFSLPSRKVYDNFKEFAEKKKLKHAGDPEVGVNWRYPWWI